MKRDRDIFLEAIELPDTGEREAYVDSACAGDADLLAKVRALLTAHRTEAGVLDQPLAALPVATPVEQPGSAVGRYRLLEQIGEGGFGVVYLAEQREPVKRRVALKIIKLGMDTRQVVARFEAERQALALMDHPNIARVFDGGATETGRPYFVMELVRGVPITRFCDENLATTAERLELFAQVCDAIQHAHQKGVIHRDIKPNNVLISLHDDRPVPKVIDFGIAKATEQVLTDKTIFTGYHELLGTPGLHESGTGAVQRPGYRHAHRHLFVGGAALRVADGPHAFRCSGTPEWRLPGDPTAHPGSGTGQAVDPAEHAWRGGTRTGPLGDGGRIRGISTAIFGATWTGW
jgi:tRNA A-37 threonylcarbamoyl transferase component Bud32